MTNLNRRQTLGLTLGLSALGVSPMAKAAFPRRTQELTFPILLSANENPWGPGPKAREAIESAIKNSSRYGLNWPSKLTAAIAAKENVSIDQVILGSGSGELLNIIALAWCQKGVVTCGWPTFNQLMNFAERVGGNARKVPLNGQLVHDLSALSAASGHDTNTLYICNPNNPTGTVVAAAPLKEFCIAMAKRTLVVVDEAYLDLANPRSTSSMVDLTRSETNLIVLRTFSKIHGLAGLRIGYGISTPDIIKKMKQYQLVFPNILGLAAATASLGDTEFLKYSRNQLLTDRARVCTTCDQLGLQYVPSEANFIFIKVGISLDEFRAKMKIRGIQVGRNFEPLTEYCRVTIGTTAETSAFIKALKEIIKS